MPYSYGWTAPRSSGRPSEPTIVQGQASADPFENATVNAIVERAADLVRGQPLMIDTVVW